VATGPLVGTLGSMAVKLWWRWGWRWRLWRKSC